MLREVVLRPVAQLRCGDAQAAPHGLREVVDRIVEWVPSMVCEVDLNRVHPRMSL